VFELTALPWAPDALEPVISAETIAFHHGKHHRAYVDKLNAMVGNTPQANASLEELVRTARGELFNNAAQAWNHDFLWRCLVPGGKPPPSAFARAIDSAFGSMNALEHDFRARALANFGSGWTWLVQQADGRLAIANTNDADNPLRRGDTPLLAVDVWEHAYYLDYRNDRGAYLDALWGIIDWQFAAANLERAARAA
jgi:Fe-Mn family superoxide dismutase